MFPVLWELKRFDMYTCSVLLNLYPLKDQLISSDSFFKIKIQFYKVFIWEQTQTGRDNKLNHEVEQIKDIEAAACVR